MKDTLRLLAVFAHPDDETLGVGGVLAKYAAEGIETYLVTATRGQRGWPNDQADYPGPDELGRQREKELRCAAEQLGLQEVILLDYMDGELAQADLSAVAAEVAVEIRRIKPQVVLTFDPHGVYGHPDHIAICQITTAALLLAASSQSPIAGTPHQCAKLYYLAETQAAIERYEKFFGEISMRIDGELRGSKSWESWAVTTQIDTSSYWQPVLKAVTCHKTQLPEMQSILELSVPDKQSLWSRYSFYRALSLVPGSQGLETSLFDGLG